MRRSLVILLALVVIVAMSGAVWRYLAAERDVAGLVLSDVNGDVGLASGAGPREARVGTRIEVDDQLRTGDGRAVLELDGGTRVRIGPSSSVVVRALDADGVDLELEGGALRATVRPESGALAVIGAGVTAQATDADFDFGVAGGVAVIDTTRGELALMGVDQPRLNAGSRAVIRNRSAAIGPIPDELLLAVAWPEPERTREAETRVSGRTAPGARVTLDGGFGTREVVADADGHFEADVPLTEGDNAVQVRAVDLFGQVADVRGVLQTRDTRGPTFRGGVEYGN